MEQVLVRTVDLETTDFPPEGAVVELGYVDMLLERNDEYSFWSIAEHPINVFQKFFDPGPQKLMSLEAKATHHIKEHEYRGQTPSSELEKYVYQGEPKILVAHSADFEKSFIPTRAGIFWIDTYKIALRLYPDFRRHTNQYLRYSLDLDLDDSDSMPPHRACPDAFTTSYLLRSFINSGMATLREMISWSQEPVFLTKMPFGKYFGQKFEDIPRDYVSWLLRQSDVDQSVRNAFARIGIT